jgi:two-component sensor histidine kinase
MKYGEKHVTRYLECNERQTTERKLYFCRESLQSVAALALHHILLYGDDVNLLREKLMRLLYTDKKIS